jgi:isopentenyl-diphosphate Delta-isomerase
MEDTEISQRKSEHLKIVQTQDVSSGLTTGFERYHFFHNALPELNLNEVDLSTTFLNRQLGLPLLVSSMTGGTEESEIINTNLARAANQARIAIGIGSQRVMLENPKLLPTFAIRKVAPDVPILANLGAIQLNNGFGLDECKRAVELVEADALILHLNPLQEALQPDGNTNWKGLRQKIEQVISHLGYPVIIKEVGWGISPDLTRQFLQMGAYAVDIAGAGGTSWSQVEMHRMQDPTYREIASNFKRWGIPTSEALKQSVLAVPGARLIASGGLTGGLDLTKSLALGACLGGMAGRLLVAATISPESVTMLIDQIAQELRVTMFACGIGSIEALHGTDRLTEIA